MRWSDIPTASAVVVLHDPDGAQPVLSSSGSISSAAVHRLDYDGRQGQYGEKGDIDRSVTDEDTRLMSRGTSLDPSVQAQLDYVARMRGFSDKGAGKMTDCTYWGQYGPLSRAQVESEMTACGGSFIKSVVSVDRRYAAELGLDSKEAFQRLMRDEWASNVLKWGVTDDPTDIRWVANYHDDAQNSLHVHVTTFFANRSPQPGWTVSAAATRAGKVGIFRSAYSRIALERDREQDYLRDRIQAIARVEMGQELPSDIAERLAKKAESLGFDPAVVKTQSDSLSESADRCVARMCEEYSKGTGRISSNWRLMSAARDLCDVLYRESPQYRDALDGYRKAVGAKADMRGLAVADAKSHDGTFREGELSASQKVTMHERDKFIRREMDDVKSRVAGMLVRTCVPEVARDAMVRRVASDAVRGSLYAAMRIHGENPLGLERSQAREVVSLLRGNPGRDEIDRAVGIVMASPSVAGRLSAATDRVMQSGPPGFASRDEAAAAVGRSAASTLARNASWRLSNDRMDVDSLAARGISRDILENRSMSLVSAGVRDGGVRLGLSRSEHAALLECLRSIRQTPAGSAPDRADIERAVGIVVSSPTVQRAISSHAEPFDRDGSTAARDAATSAVRQAVAAQLASGHVPGERPKHQNMQDLQMQRDLPEIPHLPGDQLNLDNLGSFLSQAARGAMRAGTSGATKPRRRVNEQAESVSATRHAR